METEVLLVGAGPVGLLLAAELRLAGVRPTVIERLAQPTREQKARGMGSLATEALRRRGLGAQLAAHHERGFADFRAAHGSDKGHFAWLHKIDLVPADEPERTYTFIWQPELEQLLGRWLAELGVPVLREHELTALRQDPDSVTATVHTPTGRCQVTAGYLVGCDGGRSPVRKLAGFEFPGTEPFMIMRAAQVELADPDAVPPPGQRDTGSLMHSLDGSGVGILGTTEFSAIPEDRGGPLTPEELAASVRRVAGVDVAITAIREPRRVLDHARQAERYQLGRVLLAGDAAHVHSPNGGQGLNLGLMDAVNLGWKLAASVRRGDDGPLGTYTAERHPVAAAVLHNTRAQSALLSPGPHHQALRDIVSELMDIPAVNAYFAELLNGLYTRYRLPYNKPADHDLVGQHCPDLVFGADRLYQHTAEGDPVLLTPTHAPEVAQAAAPWASRVQLVPAGLARHDLSGVLLRPDGVVAWACGPDHPPDLEQLGHAMRTWFAAPGAPDSPDSPDDPDCPDGR